MSWNVQARSEDGRFCKKSDAKTNEHQVVIDPKHEIKAETNKRILVTGSDHETVALQAAEIMIRDEINDLVHINHGKRTLETLGLSDPDEDGRLNVMRLEDKGSLGNCFLRFELQADGSVKKYDNPYLYD
jgi:hypothetical protein